MAICFAISGCGGAMKVAPVSGTVTLDGQPLERASVLFQPEKGRPSFAVTDKYGRYQLAYSRTQGGAEVGSCTVKVSGVKKNHSQSEAEEQAPKLVLKSQGQDGSDAIKVAVLPRQNTINIELTSQQ